MDLANALREERKSAELQPLDEDFYQQVGTYLTGMGQELSQIIDPFSVEAQILQDTLKSERSSLNKLIDQRIKKIVRRALEEPFGRKQPGAALVSGMTAEETEIYRQMLSTIALGRESILSHMTPTERPLTGKKDILREYEVVRLLDDVPMFAGVDGKNYLLARDDVVVLPAVHARNLRNKNLASEVKIQR